MRFSKTLGVASVLGLVCLPFAFGEKESVSRWLPPFYADSESYIEETKALAEVHAFNALFATPEELEKDYVLGDMSRSGSRVGTASKAVRGK